MILVLSNHCEIVENACLVTAARRQTKGCLSHQEFAALPHGIVEGYIYIYFMQVEFMTYAFGPPEELHGKSQKCIAEANCMLKQICLFIAGAVHDICIWGSRGVQGQEHVEGA